MANVVEILIKATNQATGVITQVAGGVAALGAAAGVSAAITARLTQKMEELITSVLSAPFALADTVEQLDRLASRTGASSEKLQVMRKVIEEGGGNAEALTTALTFLNRAIANENPLLAQLGITTKDAFAAMMQLGHAFSQSGDDAKKNAIAFALLGRGGGELIADLNSLVTTFDETNARMRRTGSLITDDLAPAARDLDKAMDELADSWAGAWTKMQAATVGPANAMLKVVDFFLQSRKEKLIDVLKFLNELPKNYGVVLNEQHPDHRVPPSVDRLKGIDTGDKKEESPRAKRLKDLQRILKLTAAEAEKTLRALEAIEDQQKRESITETLRRTESLEKQLHDLRVESGAGVSRGGPEPWETLPERRFVGRADPMKDLIDSTREVPEKQLDALTKVREQWLAFSADVLSTATILNDSIGALHSGLEAGFSTVFANLLTEGQTFKSAFLTIINSLVEAALAELARIAAAKAVVGILGLFGGGGGGAVLSAFSVTSAGRALDGAASAGRGAGRTTIVNINALDIKSGLDALVTPFGATRAIQARTAEAFG